MARSLAAIVRYSGTSSPSKIILFKSTWSKFFLSFRIVTFSFSASVAAFSHIISSSTKLEKSYLTSPGCFISIAFTLSIAFWIS